MMAPDYAHWHGMYEVAERFYQELIPQAREIAHHAEEDGKADQAKAVLTLIDDILARPEHEWFESAKKLADAGQASLTPEGAASAVQVNAAAKADGDAKPDDSADNTTTTPDKPADSSADKEEKPE